MASGTSTPSSQITRRSARQAGVPVELNAPSPPMTRGQSAATVQQNGKASSAKQFTSHALARKHDRLPPFPAIHPGQAKASTYSSRMRLGTTTLMQPLSGAVQPAPSAGISGSSSMLGKRQRTAINYAELQTLDEPPPDSDDSDAPKSRPGRPRRGQLDEGATPPPEKRSGTARSFLGQQAPPNLVAVEQAKRTRHQWFGEERLAKEADKAALLVPIRVELDTETHRIKDCFVWNTRENLITPDQFAHIFCDDLNLPIGQYKDLIALKIREQIDEFSGVAEIDVVPPELAEAHVEADLRVIVNLDLHIGILHIVDSIEWDLSSSLTPEHFANQTCLDLGISGEAAPIIAHAVHEELLRHKRDAIEAGLVGKTEGEGKDKLIVETQALNLRGPRRMDGVWREWQDSAHYVPRIEILNPADLVEKVPEQEPPANAKRANRRERPGLPLSRNSTRSSRR